MVDAVTDNRSITQPLVGGDSGTWGGILNSGVMGQLDLILGATQAISITSADVNLTNVQWNNCAIRLSGTLTGNHNLVLPLNPNSLTVAVGGLFVVDNQTAGAFNVTVKTAASGSTGVTVPQGLRTYLFSDTVNVWYADDSSIKLQVLSGNPNGVLAGTQGSVNAPPSLAWDYTNGVLYACTTTGTTTTAVWTNIVASGSPLPVPQGYLTPVSNTPIITSDSLAATAVFYTPFQGSWAVVHNGSALIAYQFTQLQLTLSASQAANNIYDVFLAYNGGTPVIGTGPSWAAGTSGSVTAGSCARGTGVGGTALSRATAGIYVNTGSMSLIYNTGSGNNTITVAAGQGVYLGSLFMDSAAGQVTCHRSTGQARKWGIWNAFNRVPLYLVAADPTASWAVPATGGALGTATYRSSNSNANNKLTVFVGLQEEVANLEFVQTVTINSGGGVTGLSAVAIGYNSTSAASGSIAILQLTNAGKAALRGAEYELLPGLGINNVNMLESGDSNGWTAYGTEAVQRLQAQWRG